MKAALLLASLAVASMNAAAADCPTADLPCRGAAGIAAAASACPAYIEQRSEFSVRWTDGEGKPKFSRFAWTSEAGGGITYVGDRVEFQNAFGAYKPMRYVCDVAKDGRTVLGARVYDGRLPIR
jgi:hypothetical protein